MQSRKQLLSDPAQKSWPLLTLLCPLPSPACWHWASGQWCPHSCPELQYGWRGPQSTETLPDNRSSCRTSIEQCLSEKSTDSPVTTVYSSATPASPRRLVEGNCANVQLLDLVDGANGEGAVVGQRQAGKKGLD